MTLKARQRNTDIVMTAIAKLAFRVHRYFLAAITTSHMTIDASGKTVFFAADTLMYGLVALMQDQFHMVSAHIGSWLDALGRLNPGRLGSRRQSTYLRIGQRLPAKGQHKPDGQHGKPSTPYDGCEHRDPRLFA